MKKTLDKAAAAGRFGDDSLLHVSKAELRGLASLHPEGKLPRNPETGLPEAFFFLPFLAGLGSLAGAGTAAAAAIPAAAAAIPAATTAAAALPAAATIGSTLGTAALPVAAEAATLGASTAASALPAASTLAGTSATPALLGAGGIDSLVAATPVANALPTAAVNPAAAPLFTPAMEATTSGLVTPSTIAAPSTVTPSATSALTPAVTPPSTIPGLNATAPTLLGPVEKAPGLGSLLGGGNMSTMLQAAAPLALMMGNSGGEIEEEEDWNVPQYRYVRGKANFKNGGDGEHDYFNDRYVKKGGGGGKAAKRKFSDGGIVTLPDGREEMRYDDQDTHIRRVMNPDGSQYSMSLDTPIMNMNWQDGFTGTDYKQLGHSVVTRDGMSLDRQALLDDKIYEAKRAKKGYAAGGLVRGYAEGGLTSLDNSPEGEMTDRQLIDATKNALLTQSPDANFLVEMFLSTFGQAALQDLISSIQGDGMSDSVPAMVQGKDGSQGIAALSEGEFVVPADVVSGLGNGSTNAGAKALDAMNNRVRSSTSNGSKQPEAMNPSDVMPV